ncbi:EAL domain-containing protein [Paenibacillus sp. TRM 82003]|nr:EAL domain-containing protein [Paenibacillus sp. TRM 82003]
MNATRKNIFWTIFGWVATVTVVIYIIHHSLLHPLLGTLPESVHAAADLASAFLLISLLLYACWKLGKRLGLVQSVRELQENDGSYKRLIETLPDPLLIHADGHIVFVNEAGVKAAGAEDARQLVGLPMSLFAQGARETAATQEIYGGTPVYEQSAEVVDFHGNPLYVEYSGIPITYKGRPAALVIVRNMSEQVRINRQLETTQQQLRLTLNNVDAGIWTYDLEEERMIAFADRLERLVGVSPGAGGLMTAELWKRLYGEEEGGFEEHCRRIAEAGAVSRDVTVQGLDGAPTSYNSRISPIADEHGRTRLLVGIVFDMTERARSEARVKHLAYHDELTGLPNRRYFKEHLQQVLERADIAGVRVALAYIDLDRFKYINDSLGHHAGDRLLQEVARRLASEGDGSSFAARLAGDEFTVILDGFNTLEALRARVEELLGRLSLPLALDGYEFFLKASAGIAVYPDHARNMDSLMNGADTAMFIAKETRNTIRFYNESMAGNGFAQARLQNDLLKAIANQELMLHYQPKYDAKTERLVGSEALLRWAHPELGFIPPADFIPIAEDIGIMNEVGRWVAAKVCDKIAEWASRGIRHAVSINLSVKQFREGDIVATIRGALEASRIDPLLLELEITESIAMDFDKVLGVLVQLNKLGVVISIDDFGTGYSSLNYLKRLPVHRLKIDKSFIRELGKDKGDAAIVSTIVSLAHNMQLKVVAEGVETSEQLQLLRSYGCDEVQGYLFSRPLPAELLEELLQPEDGGFDDADASVASGAKLKGLFCRVVLESLIAGDHKFPEFQSRIAAMDDDEWYSWDMYTEMLRTIASRVSPKAVREAGRRIALQGKDFFLGEAGIVSLEQLLKGYREHFDHALPGLPENERAKVISYEQGRVVLHYTVKQPELFSEGVLTGFFELFDTPIRSIRSRPYDRHYYEFEVCW